MIGKEKMSAEPKPSLPLPSSPPTMGATTPPQPAQPGDTHGDGEGRLPSRSAVDAQIPLPRVTIKFCTQCKWMLRAAYYAQELLSTFSTSLGEVALQPATGGVFVVQIHHVPPTPEPASSSSSSSTGVGTVPPPPAAAAAVLARTLWDRKVDGGFPETKELKRRLRDVIEPGRNLGHVDRDYPPRPAAAAASVRDATVEEKGETASARQESVGRPIEVGTPPSQPQPSPNITAASTAPEPKESAEDEMERMIREMEEAEMEREKRVAESEAKKKAAAAERVDLAHLAAVSTAAGLAGSEPKCEDCQ
ncbi:hypothetical protein RB594_002920 [Gaeumannomyces avenae]